MTVKDQFIGYSNPKKLSTVDRAADFLNWCSKKYPGRHVALRYIVRAAMQLPRLPREESEDIKSFKRKLQRVRTALRANHNQALISLRTVGYRASCGFDDVAQEVLEGRARRIVSAQMAFDRDRTLIPDLEKVKSKALRERVRQIDKARKTLGASYINQLRLPESTTDKKDKKR